MGAAEGRQVKGPGGLAQVPAGRRSRSTYFLGEEEEEAVLGKEVIQSHLRPALPESTSAPHQAGADLAASIPPAGSGLDSSGGLKAFLEA